MFFKCLFVNYLLNVNSLMFHGWKDFYENNMNCSVIKSFTLEIKAQNSKKNKTILNFIIYINIPCL